MKPIKELQQNHVNLLTRIRQLKWRLFQLTQNTKDFYAHNRARVKELEAHTNYNKEYK